MITGNNRYFTAYRTLDDKTKQLSKTDKEKTEVQRTLHKVFMKLENAIDPGHRGGVMTRH
jgi:hypothetical protein